MFSFDLRIRDLHRILLFEESADWGSAMIQTDYTEHHCLSKAAISSQRARIGSHSENQRCRYRMDRRSTVLARIKRDLAAATEIPAALAISLTELSCDCWI